jgi:hypothetical protein
LGCMRRSTVWGAIVAGACALAVALYSYGNAGGEAFAQPGEITPEIRAATLNLDNVTLQDKAWIQAAVATARPEAQRLIAEIDGLITVDTRLHRAGTIHLGVPDDAIGLTDYNGWIATISLDVNRLNGDRAIDRNMVLLHELGHVIDFVLVDDELMHQLDAGIPASRDCSDALDGAGGCTAVEERFADTFAKWALRGRFSIAGSGYGIPTPPSLEDWGMPLGRLAAELDIRVRDD